MIIDHLFYKKGDLQNYLNQMKFELKRKIEEMKPNDVLNKSEENLCQDLVSRYLLETPILHEDKKYAHKPEEIDIDISQDPMRSIRDRSRPFYVKGISVTIAVPFDGNSELFQYRPSTFSSSGPPCGQIVGKEVQLIYKKEKHNSKELKQEYTRDINEIKKHLNFIKSDIEKYNESLEPFVKQIITQRRKRLEKAKKVIEDLGIPVREHNNKLLK